MGKGGGGEAEVKQGEAGGGAAGQWLCRKGDTCLHGSMKGGGGKRSSSQVALQVQGTNP